MPLFARTPAEIPRLVAVETTNRCNARCVFCPNGALARDRTTMPDDIFEKIIEDCRQFPLPAIEPSLQGEPFSDPQIIHRLKHIRRRLPDTKLRLYTNGYGMTPDRIDELVGLGLDHLYVSLNTLDPDRYHRSMGLRLERTLANLDYLTSSERRSRVAKTITFRMLKLGDTTTAEQDDFLSFCRKHGVRPFIVGLFNYKGYINSPFPVPRYGCEHVHRLDILASGRVTLCCMDQEGEYGWGDARHSSVLELYRHQVARLYRNMHRGGHRRSIDPCGTCNNFWPGFWQLSASEKVQTAMQYGAYLVRYRPSGRAQEHTAQRDEYRLEKLLQEHLSRSRPRRASTEAPAADNSSDDRPLRSGEPC